jgi:TPR repeat protein
MNKRRQMWLLFRAHVLGDLEALHDIAAYYASAHQEGLLQRKYYEKAFLYYKRGAEKGNPACMYDYGFMVLLGEVGVKDEGVGLHWIKKAADAGDSAARDFLADYPQ